jgi:hypothetical protein
MSSSGYSLGYAGAAFGLGVSHSQCATVRETVQLRYLELVKMQELVKDSKLPTVPLLADPPETTIAIFICKVLFPRKSQKKFKDWIERTSPAVRVYPHFLVHLGKVGDEATGVAQPVPNEASPVKCKRHTWSSFGKRLLAFLKGTKEARR